MSYNQFLNKKRAKMLELSSEDFSDSENDSSSECTLKESLQILGDDKILENLTRSKLECLVNDDLKEMLKVRNIPYSNRNKDELIDSLLNYRKTLKTKNLNENNLMELIKDGKNVLNSDLEKFCVKIGLPLGRTKEDNLDIIYNYLKSSKELKVKNKEGKKRKK